MQAQSSAFAVKPPSGLPVNKLERNENWPDTLPGGDAVLNLAMDQEIYSEGAKADMFYKVVSGVVRSCKYLANGRRQIESFHRAGDIFGLEATDTYRLSAETASNCSIVAYRRISLYMATYGNDSLARQLFTHALRDMARAQDHSLLLGRHSAAEKVAFFLLSWAQGSGNPLAVNLEMSRYDIADYLNLTVETVSRTLSKMERDGLIELTTARAIWVRNINALRMLDS